MIEDHNFHITFKNSTSIKLRPSVYRDAFDGTFCNNVSGDLCDILQTNGSNIGKAHLAQCLYYGLIIFPGEIT